MTDQGKERRRFDRIPSDMDVRFSEEGEEKSYIGKLINLNGTGVCFESDHAIELGAKVEVATMDGDIMVPIVDGQIVVVRSIDRGESTFEIAGEFEELKT